MVRTFLWLSSFCIVTVTSAQTKPVPGISVTFTSAGTTATDIATNQNVALYVPAGQSPTPFLAPGKFTAVFNGLISVDLRGEYSFQADLNGGLKLEINGQNVLEATASGAVTEPSKPIRLGKGGTNTLVATFISPGSGDAFIRLQWKPRDSFVQPIPNAALNHSATPEEEKALQVRLGRELFIDHRCVKCHVGPGPDAAIPDLAMDAPSFEEIGSRRNHEWMAAWILDPKSQRPTAHMPKLLRGDNAKKDADAIAAYLASLKSAEPKPLVGDAAAGTKFFDTLHCVSCHNAPGGEVDSKKISLTHVALKFSGNALADFLKKPDAHYAWVRMPRFNLNDEQAGNIAAFLVSKAEKRNPASVSTDTAILEQGKKLVQSIGCLNCHGGKIENQFAAKSLTEITDWKKGCAAEAGDTKAPQFGFTAQQREALQAFGASDRASLTRHVPAEFAARFTQTLNCRDCHGPVEGIPHFDLLGGKLKPEWAGEFIAGGVKYKPRPWLEAQMPAFPKYADALAKGMAMQHGLPPQTPTEPATEQPAIEIGNKLVSNPPLGFACVSCHSVGTFGATQVFEAPGINLAHTGERLQPRFFKRWLRNPPAVDPQTKMPAYFDDEGKSPLTDVYEGDADKQIAALWQYVRLGDKMPQPKSE